MELLERKYCSPQIKDLTPEQVEVLAGVILQSIHVCTGWVIPDDDNLLSSLVRLFTKHLSETYGAMNIEEIEYAFRNETSVKDWGKNMNLNLIDQVLLPYLEKRFFASRIEEQEISKIHEQKKQLPPAPMPDQEIIDYAYDTWNFTGHFEFIAVKAFSILKRNGIVPTEEERVEIKSRAKALVEVMSQEDSELFRRESKESYVDSYAKKLFCQKVFTRYRDANEKIIVA